MTIAQCKATRRKRKADKRWRPRKGNRAGGYASVSARLAAARQRKRVQMGGRAGSIGYKVK